jgi:hypothetical protein
MSAMSNLFQTFTRQRMELLALIAGLPDAELNRKGVVGEWSVKNVLAHLTAWEAVVVQITPERLATGARPALLSAITADEDGWNDAETAKREHLTPDQQVEEMERTRGALIDMINGFGKEALGKKQPWPEWEGTLAEYFAEAVGGHEAEHMAAIRAAVERQTA